VSAAIRLAVRLAEARLDQLPDGLGAARNAARIAEVLDPIEELAAHGDDDALSGEVGLCNHAPNMHDATIAVNVPSNNVAYVTY
jgi:hypothetical protein